jgi:hypothetical protein
MSSDRSLKNFIQSFVDEHTLTSGGELVLDISQEEIQALGDFFVRGMCGWMLGLKRERANRRLIEVTKRDGLSEPLETGVKEKLEEKERDKEPIN